MINVFFDAWSLLHVQFISILTRYHPPSVFSWLSRARKRFFHLPLIPGGDILPLLTVLESPHTILQNIKKMAWNEEISPKKSYPPHDKRPFCISLPSSIPRPCSCRLEMRAPLRYPLRNPLGPFPPTSILRQALWFAESTSSLRYIPSLGIIKTKTSGGSFP